MLLKISNFASLETLKACWNSDFQASGRTEISKNFRGAAPGPRRGAVQLPQAPQLLLSLSLSWVNHILKSAILSSPYGNQRPWKYAEKTEFRIFHPLISSNLSILSSDFPLKYKKSSYISSIILWNLCGRSARARYFDSQPVRAIYQGFLGLKPQLRNFT